MSIKQLLDKVKNTNSSNLYDNINQSIEEIVNDANNLNYNKPKPSIKTEKTREDQCIVIIPDIHAHARDVPAYELVMQHALPALNKGYNVTKVVQLGDLLDVAELTSHAPSHLDEVVPKYEDELNWAIGDFWKRVMASCPKAEYYALMGNHEHRINTYVSRNYAKKEFAKYINDNLDPRKIYEEMGINVTPYGAEYAYENMLEVFPGIYCVHGWSHASQAAKAHLQKINASASMIFGHTHRIDSYISPIAGSGKQVGAWSFGALQKKNRHYNKGIPNDHALGFGIILTHGDAYSVYTIQIHGDENSTHRHCILPNGTVLESK
jgi:predicted phosphodiesterase